MALSLGLGIGLTRGQGGGLRSFRDYLTGPQVLNRIWIDYTDPDWLRQEPTGGAAVAVANDVIGLAPSRGVAGQGGTQAAYLAGQPELANPAGGTNRSIGTGTSSQTGGAVTLTGTNSSNFGGYDFPISTVAGRLYRVDFTVGGSASFCGIWQNAGFSGVISGTTAGRLAGAHTIFFTAGAATTFFGAQTVSTGGTTTLSGFTIKEVSRAAATQTTQGFKPKFDGDAGAIHDALDDRTRGNLAAQAGSNLALASIRVADTLSGTQVILGANGATDTADRMRLAITSGGLLRTSVCSAEVDGAVDLRGQTIPVGLAAGGGVARAFVGTQQVAEFAYTGTINTAVPFAFGGRNNNGTDGNFWGGRIRRIGLLHTQDLVDGALWSQIATAPGFHVN